MKRFFKVSLYGFSFALTIVGIAKAECVPQMDSIKYSSNVYLKYFYYDQYLKDLKSKDNTSVGISIYDIVGLNYNQASDINEFVRKTEAIDATYSKQEEFAKSQMSDKELDAYKACLAQKDPIKFSTSTNPIINKNFTFTVNFHPEDNNEDVDIIVSSVDNANIRLSADATHATVRAERHSVANSEVSFFISRNVFRPTNLTIEIVHPTTKQITTRFFYMPPAPTHDFHPEDVTAKSGSSYHGYPTPVKSQMISCIILDKGQGYILPGSVHANWSEKVQWGAEFDEQITYDSPEKACVIETINYTSIANGEVLRGAYIATGRALLTRPIPYDEAVSGRP